MRVPALDRPDRAREHPQPEVGADRGGEHDDGAEAAQDPDRVFLVPQGVRQGACGVSTSSENSVPSRNTTAPETPMLPYREGSSG